MTNLRDELIQKQKEYIGFLSEHIRKVSLIASIHGFSADPDDISKSKTMRAEISDLEKSIETESPSSIDGEESDELLQCRGLLHEVLVRCGVGLPVHEELIDLFDKGFGGESELMIEIYEALFTDENHISNPKPCELRPQRQSPSSALPIKEEEKEREYFFCRSDYDGRERCQELCLECSRITSPGSRIEKEQGEEVPFDICTDIYKMWRANTQRFFFSCIERWRQNYQQLKIRKPLIGLKKPVKISQIVTISRGKSILSPPKTPLSDPV